MIEKVSRHFKRSEFGCQCGCGFDVVDVELLMILERLRDTYDRPIYISSGCRCAAHNHSIGGSPASQHLFGKAADIIVMGIAPAHVCGRMMRWYPDIYGIGEYPTWTHIDVRDGKARWSEAST